MPVMGQRNKTALNVATFSDMSDDRSCLKIDSWTRWLPQGLSRPVILWVPSVASLQKLEVNETQQVSAFSGAPIVSKEAVTAAAQQHLFQQKTSLKGESGRRGHGCCLFLQISLGLSTGTLGDNRPQDTLPSHQYKLC